MIAKVVDAPPIVTSCIGMCVCMVWCTGACVPCDTLGAGSKASQASRPLNREQHLESWSRNHEVEIAMGR